MNNKPVQKIEISAQTILFTIGLLIALWLVWIMKDLLFSLFIAFIVMSAVRPLVGRLEEKGVPRQISTFLSFAAILGVFGWVVYWIVPPLATEMAQLFKQLPAMINNIDSPILTSLNIGSVFQYFPNITNQALSIVGGVFSNAVFFMSTLFFSMYLTMEKNILASLLLLFFSQETTDRYIETIRKIEKRTSAWFWGELTLMTVIGVLTFIGLNLIGVKYALPLALIAGILEVVPNIGPVLATVPAFFVALTHSYFLGFSTLALYFIIQQLENNFIVPYIMRKAVGLHPIVTLIALIVGGRIGGVLGVLLAIPMTLVAETIIIDILKAERSGKTGMREK